MTEDALPGLEGPGGPAPLEPRRLQIPATPKRPRQDSRHCGRDTCLCTHTESCDRGWIELPPWRNPETGLSYDRVAPCPVCRHQAADRIAQRLERTSRDAQ